jgi:hypothetical protein
VRLRLILLTLCLAVIPAIAQNDIYDNGPIDGNTTAYTINFGFAVSDQFTLGQSGNISGVEFGAWLTPGDVLETVDVQITSDEFGGTTFFSGTVNFSQGGCTMNQFGFNVCTEVGDFQHTFLNAGSYWLNMQNAVVSDGDPVYWDENNGPSRASENSLGTIPSESFTVLASSGGTTSTTNGTSDSMPEPSSIILFGSALLGVAGMLRRKF